MVYMGSVYCSRNSFKLGQNNVAENDEAILSIPYSGIVTSSTMFRDICSAEAVVRDSSEQRVGGSLKEETESGDLAMRQSLVIAVERA
jgi:hypothetical protein